MVLVMLSLLSRVAVLHQHVPDLLQMADHGLFGPVSVSCRDGIIDDAMVLYGPQGIGGEANAGTDGLENWSAHAFPQLLHHGLQHRVAGYHRDTTVKQENPIFSDKWQGVKEAMPICMHPLTKSL